jgi:hypothetical protein
VSRSIREGGDLVKAANPITHILGESGAIMSEGADSMHIRLQKVDGPEAVDLSLPPSGISLGASGGSRLAALVYRIGR